MRPNPGFQQQLINFGISEELEQLRVEFRHGPNLVTVVNQEEDLAMQAAIVEVCRVYLVCLITLFFTINLQFLISVVEASTPIITSVFSTQAFSTSYQYQCQWIGTSITSHHRSHFG